MFSDALSIADDLIAGVMDEVPCILLPKMRPAGPNSVIVDDPERGAFGFMGCFDQGPVRSNLEATSRDTPASNGRHLNGEIVLSALIIEWPYQPVKTDSVEVDGVVMKITEIHRDGTNRVLFYLSKAT